MTSRRTLLLGLGVLVALQLLTSAAAIGVLTRMSPAIELILQENEYSIEAAEAMLAELAASAGDPATDPARARAHAALDRIRRNVTEPEELAPIAEIERHLAPALEGDAASVAALVRATNHLVAINRAAMRGVDQEAQRLGTAGAWTAVVLGVLAFLLSIVVADRLNRRLLAPLLELSRVLDAFRAGDRQRRCQPADAAPDVRRVLEGADALLDGLFPREQAGRSRSERAARAALLALLDAGEGPSFVVDRGGAIAAANSQGLARLAAAEGVALRQALASLAEGGPTALPSVEVAPLGEDGWLCRLPPVGGTAAEGA